MTGHSASEVHRTLPHQWEWGAMLLVLFLAAVLRLYSLDSVPPGLTHDEAAHLQDARRIWEGARPLYLTSALGREPLYDYATSPLVGLLGLTTLTGRFSSVLWGLPLIALSYVALRRMLDPPGAVVAALLMAVSFWPVSTSRQILRSITLPVLFTAVMILVWRGLYGSVPGRESGRRSPFSRAGHLGYFAGAGALLGLAFYTYMPARVMWVVPCLFWLSTAFEDQRRFRTRGSGILVMLFVTAVVSAPLLIHLARHPELEVRVAELAVPLRAAFCGSPTLLLDRIAETVLMFSHRGDVHWMYNLSGRPLLAPPLVVLFYLGLVIALIRLRQPGPRLLMLWLIVGISMALVTGLESSSVRAIAAQPAVFGLCALPVTELGRWVSKRGTSFWAKTLLVILFVVLSGWVAVDTVRAYFVTWAEHRDVRVAYHTHLVAEAEYLQREGIDGVVAISTFYPDRPHDPAAMEAMLGPDGLDLRWFDGRDALVFPSCETAYLLVPSAVPLPPALERMVGSAATPVSSVSLYPTDLVTSVAVVQWSPEHALSEALAQASGAVSTYPDGPLPPDHAYLPLALPVDIDEELSLVGYRLLTPELAPGSQLELVTLWRSLGPADRDVVLFAHLVDDENRVLGQADRLDAPAWNWHPGEAFAQVHRFTIADDTPPGRYHLQVGAYWRETGTRLPVRVGEEAVGTRILLEPVEVGQP